MIGTPITGAGVIGAVTMRGASKAVPAQRLASLAATSIAALTIVGALAITPSTARAAGAGMPSAGADTSTQSPPAQRKPSAKKNAPGNRSSLEDFITGYKAAYALIYEQGDYQGAIVALRALEHDDNADVANLIGYASRKLGRYDDAKVWYERSLAADPNHAVTWSYYGMWQAEQGNLLKAKDDLEKVRLICGTTCEPYQMLKAVIDGTATY
jgi:tetratricopeptide (TPR) repeat protein